MGRTAIANGDDVSDVGAAERIIKSAIDNFGDLHVVVNNAGILRDRTLANMTIEEWDAVIRVHLRGTFSMSHHAAVYWRDKSKGGTPVNARIINTTSPTGLYGNIGQANYGAAKPASPVHHHRGDGAGALRGHRQLHLTGARTRMTETIIRRAPTGLGAEADFDTEGDPDNISPIVAWLGGANRPM